MSFVVVLVFIVHKFRLCCDWKVYLTFQNVNTKYGLTFLFQEDYLISYTVTKQLIYKICWFTRLKSFLIILERYKAHCMTFWRLLVSLKANIMYKFVFWYTKKKILTIQICSFLLMEKYKHRELYYFDRN